MDKLEGQGELTERTSRAGFQCQPGAPLTPKSIVASVFSGSGSHLEFILSVPLEFPWQDHQCPFVFMDRLNLLSL